MTKVLFRLIFALTMILPVTFGQSAFAVLSKTIVTQNLIIHPVEENDIPQVAPWFSDPDVTSMSNTIAVPENLVTETFKKAVVDTKDVIEGAPLDSSKLLGFVFVEKSSGKIIGFGGYINNHQNSYWTSSTLIGRQFWGKGFATEARGALAHFLFSELKIEGLISEVSINNPASRRVTEKLKFQNIREISIPEEGREIAIDPDINIIDYRLSRERALNPVMVPRSGNLDFKISPATLAALSKHQAHGFYFFRGNGPAYYKILMADDNLKTQVGPETLSVIADEMDTMPRSILESPLSKIISHLNIHSSLCNSEVARLAQ